jgi:hypothetical protein
MTTTCSLPCALPIAPILAACRAHECLARGSNAHIGAFAMAALVDACPTEFATLKPMHEGVVRCLLMLFPCDRPDIATLAGKLVGPLACVLLASRPCPPPKTVHLCVGAVSTTSNPRQLTYALSTVAPRARAADAPCPCVCSSSASWPARTRVPT